MKAHEYIIRQYVPEMDYEYLRSTNPEVITDLNEAIEWAKFYGQGSIVYKRDEYYNETQVYFVRFNTGLNWNRDKI
jgi:hypothetical protein